MNENVDPQQVDAPNPAKSTAPAPPRRGGGRLIWVVVLVVAAALAWRFWPAGAPAPDAQSQSASGGPPQTVRDAPATTGDMPITIDALGAVTPLATITVKTQIAGRLMEVGFQEGQLVKQGDFLAQIDSRPYEAALAQAQAQLAKDSALLDQAQADFTRYQTLQKQDSIARQQVEDQQYTVAQDKAAVAADQAQIDTAKLNIAYCRIVAPVSGRVGLRLVDPGNYLQPSDATGIVVIAEIAPISVLFSTAEDNLPQIAARMKTGATLTVSAYDRTNSKALATGTVSTFDNQIDLTTGTFKLRAQFDNSDGALFPNQFVNIKLLVDTMSGATLAPNPAIQIGASGSFVYVVKPDSTVAVRKVTTGPADAKNTVITSGLTPGENVVIDGVDRLRDGAKVVVRNGGGASTGAPGDASGAGPRRKRAQDQGGAAPTPGASATPSPTPNSAPSPSPSSTPSPSPNAAQ
jgi:multidrug efflux system membrane fusion protein